MPSDMQRLPLREYKEINAHLRANMGQFVNWFSLFLTLSFVAAAAFVGAAALSDLLVRHSGLRYGIPIVFLLMHVLAFTGIVIFRRYIAACHSRVEVIVHRLEQTDGSPIPVRFCQWMTDLMAAGFVISYFTWLSMLFLR